MEEYEIMEGRVDNAFYFIFLERVYGWWERNNEGRGDDWERECNMFFYR